MAEALEAEVSAYLGRGYYNRGERLRTGYRNGYENTNVKTAEGKVNVPVPQLRDSGETYQCGIMSNLPSISSSLEKAAVESYVRGLSTRDIEEVFVDEKGESILSKDSVSTLSETLWKQYDEF